MRIRRREEHTGTETVLFIISLLILAFIWGHSLMSGDDSSQESSSLYLLVKPIFDFIFGEDVITHGIFRKLAHFSEFCVFCIFLTLLYWKCYPLIFSFLVACVDESIQIFTPDRGPSFRDVMIDFSGAVFGFILTVIVIKLLLLRKKSK